MKLTDKQLLAISLVGIVLVSLLNVLITPTDTPLEIDHEYASGIRSLRLWLEESGYQVNPIVDHQTDLTRLDVLFLINPYISGENEGVAIRDWVRDGGTLILAGTGQMLDFYGMSIVSVNTTNGISQSGPTLITPPINGDLRLDRAYGLDRWESAKVNPLIHVTVNDVPVIASWPDGEGQVWYVGSVYPFTNRGIRNIASARFILNLMAATPAPSTVGFSEGIIETGETLFDLLTTTPPGWAVLSGIGLTYLFLALRGRRFGSPIPLPQERLRREPVEYIEAMANLFRHSGEREEILKHYHRQVRRHLIQRYGLDATLSDRVIVEIAVQRDDTLDTAALNNLFEMLNRQRVSEVDLIKTAQAVDEWMDTHRSLNG